MTVYLGARDLNGMFVGTHQFLVLINDSLLVSQKISGLDASAKFLGKKNGKYIYGVVIGAQNRGNLAVEFFENSDYLATKEYFGGSDTKWYKSDFDAEMYEVGFDLPDSVAIKQILFRVETFIINQTMDPIRYPTAGLGFNSNSWAQSVIQYAGGKVQENVTGADVASDKRIPQTYFEPICPIKKRPKLN